MSLQLSFAVACEVRFVGTLALVGTAEEEGDLIVDDSNDVTTTVTFLLSFADDAPLAGYFHPRGGFRPGSLLYAIFVGEGAKVLESVGNGHQCFLVFNTTLNGRLRDPQKFLHSVARSLLRNLQELEDEELSLDESADQLEWCEHDMLHPGRRGSIPDFTRPRHR